MSIRTRMAVALVAVVAAGLVVAGIAVRHPDPVIARADGVAITLSEARSRVAGVATAHGGDPSKVLGPDWRDQILQSLIDDVIVQREAGRMGIEVTGGDLELAIGRIKSGFESPGAFAKWLLDRKMDEQELARRMRLQLLAARVYERVTSDVKATDAEILAYYRKHAGDFTGGDGKPRPLDEVRDQVAQAVAKDKKDSAYGAWLAERRRGLKVVVLSKDWT